MLTKMELFPATKSITLLLLLRSWTKTEVEVLNWKKCDLVLVVVAAKVDVAVKVVAEEKVDAAAVVVMEAALVEAEVVKAEPVAGQNR
jgi:hypothetical protein